MNRNPWDKWYDKKRWIRLARYQLNREPLCRFCLERGEITPATVADHIIPHKGDQDLFWNGELQSLCTSCHGKVKQEIETKGFFTDIGVDGWPIDRNHPVYGGAGGISQKR